MRRVAIVGGGPGGLISAYFLRRKIPDLAEITIFEASDRLGGKILTNCFQKAPVKYEAGVAELYGYWHLGEDPLFNLITDLGLRTVPLGGSTVVMDDCVMRGMGDVRRHFGKKTAREIKAFRRKAASVLSPRQYYDAGWPGDNQHKWSGRTFDSLLSRVKDPEARRFLSVASHSDVAAEPHEVSGLFGAENVLMDNPRYVKLYSLHGGLETLPQALADALSARISRRCQVSRVEKLSGGAYRVCWRAHGEQYEDVFDAVMIALPNYWIPTITWGGELLSSAMKAHHAYYDSPAHYLRITVLFRERYWRNIIIDPYFQLSAFGGCCVYDESAKFGSEPYGVLSWLLSGSPALTLSNRSDDELIGEALDSLPRSLKPPTGAMLEGSVNRWVGTVSAKPGGVRFRDAEVRHRPEPKEHSRLLMVGDYLFDSTINGVVDSAEIATDLLAKALIKLQAKAVVMLQKTNGIGTDRATVKDNYFKHYDGSREYGESFKDYFDASWVANLIQAVWGCVPPYKLLDGGSASGLTLREFEKIGVESWGVENNPAIHSQTPLAWRTRNLFGDVCSLPFPDGAFDFVYDTCLCYVAERDLERALAELLRVTKRGLVFGSITRDYTRKKLKKHDLADGLKVFDTQSNWARRFLRSGWQLAVSDEAVIDRVWKIERDANNGKPWYQSAEVMRYCFFSSSGAEAIRTNSNHPDTMVVALQKAAGGGA